MARNKQVSCSICHKKMRNDNLKRHMNIHNWINSQEKINESSSSIQDKLNSKKNNVKEVLELSNYDFSFFNKSLKDIVLESKQESSIENIILKPWQQEVIDLLSENNYNNRSIYVLYDPIGGLGKTTLKKYLDKFDDIITISGPRKENLYYGYHKLYNNLDKKFWKIIIDLPRVTSFVPSFIEEIKDGVYPSYNYYQSPIKIKQCSIILFINKMTILKDLSIDRLCVYRVLSNCLSKQEIELTNKNNIRIKQRYLNQSNLAISIV